MQKKPTTKQIHRPQMLKKVSLALVMGYVKIKDTYEATFVFDVQDSTSKLIDADFVSSNAVCGHYFSKN